MRFLEVWFSGSTVYLRLDPEGARAVAPYAWSMADRFLEQAVYRVTGRRGRLIWQHHIYIWEVPIERPTPGVCRRISHTFQKLLMQEQRRLEEVWGEPGPAPKPVHYEDDEVEAPATRVPTDATDAEE
jgi:hypothetical protein